MTYFSFHLIFNLPVFVLLMVLARKRLQKAHVLWISVVAGVALVAAAPWDNWAVHKGYWGFDWARTTPISVELFDIVWKLPLEEYSFFVIETVLVGLLVVLFLPHPRKAP